MVMLETWLLLKLVLLLLDVVLDLVEVVLDLVEVVLDLVDVPSVVAEELRLLDPLEVRLEVERGVVVTVTVRVSVEAGGVTVRVTVVALGVTVRVTVRVTVGDWAWTFARTKKRGRRMRLVICILAVLTRVFDVLAMR
jgi:hypothetical protein